MKNSLLIVGTACVAIALGSCNKSSSTPDTEEGNWVKRGQFDGAARAGAVSFVINDTAYVGTGYNKDAQQNEAGKVLNGYFKDFWKFNIPSETNGNYYWTQVASLPGDYRSKAVGFNIGNKGFVGTGESGTANGQSYLKDFWEFDGKTWTARADYPNAARIEAVGFGINGKGYITTGYDAQAAYLKDIAMYDTTSKTWTTTGIPTLGGDKRRGAIAMVYNNKAYVVTGSSATYANDMFSFDGTNWKEMEKISNVKDDSFDDDYSDIVREYGVGFVIGNYGYITTGDVGSTNSKTWRYDFVNDRWVRRTGFEHTSRSRAVAFTVKGRAFVGLGVSGSSSYLDNFSEFKPNETYNSAD